ncbi:amidohydrolase family protein [Amycolatopsis sp. OK19-0408]|uniref:Amidohydrolase family protein n=1 Tax=Amycolatopsis iheyensis TaxID=2945988 RepID=A0A9X2NF24_9PSEU|nr:amidohydrolase family protein [Amycolatopsis iheyensis]MCR6485687.1 amidohydrolase family protein [Amycolatopsis iheyensis]
MIIRVRGYALPSGEYVDLYADGDRWTTDPVAGATLVGEGWLVPGLVDVHTHPGVEAPGAAPDPAMLRAHLRQHLEAGVTLIRSPGLPAEPPPWFGEEGPRVSYAGPWLAQHGQFIDGWGVRGEPGELPALAAKQAAAAAWVKVIADWKVGDPALSADVLTGIVREAHAAGARVAVHSQHAEGGAAAVAAGVDSLEHGMGLDPDLLPRMASQGTALTPTLATITESLRRRENEPDSQARTWYLSGARVHGALAVAAVEAGVRLLAGTDSLPHGGIVAEIRALVAAGVRPHDALAAASWSAREYLGLPGLEPGAPADAVVYDRDPRADLAALATPVAVVLRGRYLV